MSPKNILDIRNRGDFRDWLIRNSTAEKECWIAVKRGKTPPIGDWHDCGRLLKY